MKCREIVISTQSKALVSKNDDGEFHDENQVFKELDIEIKKSEFCRLKKKWKGRSKWYREIPIIENILTENSIWNITWYCYTSYEYGTRGRKQLSWKCDRILGGYYWKYGGWC